MQKIKTVWIISLILMILSFTFSVYADEEIKEEDVSKEEIEEILQASANINEIPIINARYAVIYDRISRKCIIWKKRTYKS